MFLCNEFPPGPGGIGTQAKALVEFFISRKYSVVVVTASRRDYPDIEFDQAAGFSIFRYPAGSSLLNKIWSLIKLIWRFRKMVDAVIVSGLAQQLLILPMRLINMPRITSIIHGHEAGMVNSFLRKLLFLNLSCAVRVIAVSDVSKNALLRRGFKGTVLVIPNGVKGTFLETPKIQNRPNKLSLVTVGSLTKRKGQQNVIRALPMILARYQEVRYHLIGAPIEAGSIRKLARELGVEESVTLHGFLNEAEKSIILSKSDIFLMLSENLSDGDMEGFGIALLEANLLGIPTIGARDTGTEQAVSSGMSGEIVDAKSPEEITNAISKILGAYESYSRGALAWARAHDWELIGERYLDVLFPSR